MRLAWLVARAFMGYTTMALMPLTIGGARLLAAVF